jgi:hypothetical protein
MTIMKEAVPLDEWERMDKGLSSKPKMKVLKPDPEPPEVPNRIEFKSINLNKVIQIEAVRKNIVKNEEGMRFIGFDVSIEVKDSGPLRGWILEGDLRKLLPYVRDNTDDAILGSIF